MHELGMPEFILIVIAGALVTEVLCWLVRKI